MGPDYPCPCCGYVVFGEPAGSDDICPICFWEDDLWQLRFVDSTGGANRPSLVEAQRNYASFGCSEPRLLQHVRPPSTFEQRDPEWRPVNVASDVETRARDVDYGRTYPSDHTTLYYWRSSYWRRLPVS
jgi:hypothetical protein